MVDSFSLFSISHPIVSGFYLPIIKPLLFLSTYQIKCPFSPLLLGLLMTMTCWLCCTLFEVLLTLTAMANLFPDFPLGVPIGLTSQDSFFLPFPFSFQMFAIGGLIIMFTFWMPISTKSMSAELLKKQLLGYLHLWFSLYSSFYPTLTVLVF